MSLLTIVIPCRNESSYIRECVEAVYACDLPDDYSMQVFIVDGMSDDGTVEEIHRLEQEYHGLRLVENIRKLTPYAFNLGIHAGGKSDFVQIVGARHILSKNYLSECLKVLNDHPEVWCAGGRIINEYENNTGEIIAKAMSTSFGMGLGNFRTLQRSGFTDTVTSPMYPYSVFEEIGFFDEDLVRNQDDDFNFRVTQAGGKIYYCHEISLKYYVRGSYSKLWRQFFQYGYWKVFVNRKHKAVTTIRQLVPPAFVAFLLLTPVIWLISAPAGAAAFLLLLLYNLLGLFVAFRTTQKPKDAVKIWLTFPVLHVSYGLGYLKGMTDFLLLRKQPSRKAQRLSR